MVEPKIKCTFVILFQLKIMPTGLAIAEEVIRDNREYMIEHWKLFFKNTKMQ
jgi:hypothetical protein